MKRASALAAAVLGALTLAWIAVPGAAPARAEGDPVPGAGSAAAEVRPQEAPAAEVAFRPPPAPRAGLEFLIGSDLTLSSFDGALISYRTRNASGGGWRLGADLGGSVSTFERRWSTPDTAYTDREKDRSVRIGVVLQRVFAARVRNGLDFYWGTGPDVGYSFSRRILNNPGSADRTTSWHAGIAGSAGVEWLAAERVSLLAEYGLTASYAWNRSRGDPAPGISSVAKNTSFSVTARQARFGLTAWFR
jgi:hypothetical protein